MARILGSARLPACACIPLAFGLVTAGPLSLAVAQSDAARESALGNAASGAPVLVADPGLGRYVAGVGKALAPAIEGSDFDWRFDVVDDPTPSAFASSEGRVYVTRGLLTLLGSEAELAAVLSHVIGHVAAGHAPQGVRYTEDDEREADRLGLGFLLDRGYAAAAMQDALAALAASNELGRGRVPAWIRSHPRGAGEATALDELLARLTADERQGVAKARAYLRRVDGLAYGDNPRHGYFDGDMFYHPELKFELSVPATWQRRNTAAALRATSPAGNTALELTLVPAPDAGAAAADFFAAGGISELGTSPTQVNGSHAFVSRFARGSEAGSIDGIAVHIEHAGKVVRLLVYATQGPFSGHEQIAERIVESFAPVTDELVLNVEGPRLRIVNLDRDMSLTEFAREYPSVVPIEELALINGVEGPAATLRSGKEAKQVTT